MSFISTIVIALPSVEAFFYAFHLAMLILMIFERKPIFKGAFYNIYRILLAADILYWLTYIICLRIPAWGIAVEIYKNSNVMGLIYLIFASHLSVVQFIGQTMLSFNRFTVLWFTSRHDQIWRRHWYTVLLILLPFCHIVYRLHIPSYYIFKDNGQVSLTLSDANVKAVVVQINFYIYIGSTFLEGGFTLLSLLKYFSLGKSGVSNIKKHELRLLLISSVIFFTQLLRSAYSYFRPNFETNEELKIILPELVPLTADICAWARSLSLILLSYTARRAFYKFYWNKNADSIFTTSVQQIKPVKR